MSSLDLALDVRTEGSFILVVSPKEGQPHLGADWLAELLRNNRVWFRDAFFRHGAIIFRGFEVMDALAFEQVALSMNPELEEVYIGTSPRSHIEGTRFVHTAADFQPHRTVPPHLEMSFRDAPPVLQIFYASRLEHTQGGETPLVDFRGVWIDLQEDLAVRAKFEGRMVTYVRNYDDCDSVSRFDPLMQKCWGDMFKTDKRPDTRPEVLHKCAAESFNCTWDAAGTLKIENAQPWIRRHPVTGDATWFNHMNVLKPESMVYDYERTATLWGGVLGLWPLLLSFYYRTLFAAMSFFREERQLGSTALFDDGSLVPRELFMVVKKAIWSNTFQAPYRKHDIVILDNLRIGHGREIYLGPKESRQIMTAWSNKHPREWLEHISEA